MLSTVLILLFLLLAANGAPVLTSWLSGNWCAYPVDFGLRFPDGRPLLGCSKSWRGVLVAVSVSTLFAWLLGLGAVFGFVFGLLVMLGDLLASFAKRRLGMQPSAQSIGWDQIPESLLPSLYAVSALSLTWWWSLVLVVGFSLIELLISKPLYQWGVRKKPY